MSGRLRVGCWIAGDEVMVVEGKRGDGEGETGRGWERQERRCWMELGFVAWFEVGATIGKSTVSDPVWTDSSTDTAGELLSGTVFWNVAHARARYDGTELAIKQRYLSLELGCSFCAREGPERCHM